MSDEITKTSRKSGTKCRQRRKNKDRIHNGKSKLVNPDAVGFRNFKRCKLSYSK